MEENVHNNFDDFLRDKLEGEPPENSAYAPGRREADAQWAKMTLRLDNIKPLPNPHTIGGKTFTFFHAAAAAVVVIGLTSLIYLYQQNNNKIDQLSKELARTNSERRPENQIATAPITKTKSTLSNSEHHSDNTTTAGSNIGDNSELSPSGQHSDYKNPISTNSTKATLSNSERRLELSNAPVSTNATTAVLSKSNTHATIPSSPSITINSNLSSPVRHSKSAIAHASKPTEMDKNVSNPANQSTTVTNPLAQATQNSQNTSSAINTSTTQNEAVNTPTTSNADPLTTHQGVISTNRKRYEDLQGLPLKTENTLRNKNIVFDDDLRIPVIVRRNKNAFDFRLQEVRTGLTADWKAADNYFRQSQDIAAFSASAELLFANQLSLSGGLGFGGASISREGEAYVHKGGIDPDHHHHLPPPNIDTFGYKLNAQLNYIDYRLAARYYINPRSQWQLFAGVGIDWQQDQSSLGKFTAADKNDPHQVPQTIDVDISSPSSRTYVNLQAGMLHLIGRKFAIQFEANWGKRIDGTNPELANYYGVSSSLSYRF